MAPKSLPPAAKQALILQWFHRDSRAYSLKELESTIPSVASIHSIQVKEYIQNLSDENLIRIEKIGSSNWYWSFVSDAKKDKEKVLGELIAESERVEKKISDAEKAITEEENMRLDHESDDETEEEKMLGEDVRIDRRALIESLATLLKENEALENELEEYNGNDPEETLRKEQETKRMKESAERWTDNLEAVETYLIKLTGDRAKIRGLMTSICGGEYEAGEGFKDM